MHKATLPHSYRRILALVDFSDSGRQVARRALKLARLEDAKLAFLHLIPLDAQGDGGYPRPAHQDQARAFEQAAMRRLDFLRTSLDAGEVELLARYAPPNQGFANCIATWAPDLVVTQDDPGFLDGGHDLLILGRKSPSRGALMSWLRRFLLPGELLGHMG